MNDTCSVDISKRQGIFYHSSLNKGLCVYMFFWVIFTRNYLKQDLFNELAVSQNSSSFLVNLSATGLGKTVFSIHRMTKMLKKRLMRWFLME